MRAHADLDQRIARLGGTRGAALPLALQAQNLAVGDAGRHIEVERTAARQRHALGRAGRRLEEIDLKRVADVVALGDEVGSRAGTLAGAAENIGEDVAETEFIEAAATGSRAGARTAVLAETGMARIAAAVDLSPVVGAALVRVAQDLVGRGDFLE